MIVFEQNLLSFITFIDKKCLRNLTDWCQPVQNQLIYEICVGMYLNKILILILI